MGIKSITLSVVESGNMVTLHMSLKMYCNTNELHTNKLTFLKHVLLTNGSILYEPRFVPCFVRFNIIFFN